MKVDILKIETHTDAWETYRWLREEDPVYWDETNELWVISRYDDVVAISRDPETWTSEEGNRAKLGKDASFIHMDGPEHLKRRGLIQKQFTKGACEHMEHGMRAMVRSLLQPALERGQAEFVEEIAAPFPLRVINRMLGNPPEMDAKLNYWLDVFTHGGNGPEYVTEEVQESYLDFAGYHYDLTEKRMEEPKEDLISLWLNAKIDGVPLDDEQVLFEHTMVLVGGSESTRNVMSGGLYQLITHPEQWDWLKAHPEDIPNAVEEMTRWVSPFVSMSRTVTRDVEFGGKQMKEGQELVMLYPAANRDPRAFDDPDTFNVRREFPKKPLAFGYGRHHCLGANLARLEIRIILEEVIAACSKVELAGEPTWRVSSFIRGPKTMPVRFIPA